MRSQRGISLLETLIAIVVVGFGLAVFFKTQHSSWARSRGTSVQYKIAQLVQKDVEAIRMAVAMDTARNWPPGDTTFSERGITLQRRVSEALSPRDGLKLPNVRKVTLSVVWNEGQKDSITLETYVSKRF